MNIYLGIIFCMANVLEIICKFRFKKTIFLYIEILNMVGGVLGKYLKELDIIIAFWSLYDKCCILEIVCRFCERENKLFFWYVFARGGGAIFGIYTN